MKTKKIANYLKTGILLFGISLLLLNCEKKIDFETPIFEQIGKQITLEEFKSENNTTSIFKGIEKNLDIHTLLGKSGKNKEKIIVLTD
mgnify:CR=1 FL=1